MSRRNATTQRKAYVSFIISDGDNLNCWDSAHLPLWNAASRRQVALAWNVMPGCYELIPDMLAHYYEAASDNDCFIACGGGVGYANPKHFWPSKGKEGDIAARIEEIRRLTDGIRPAFINAFTVNWCFDPDDVVKVMEGLGPDFIAVRPDQLTELVRQHLGEVIVLDGAIGTELQAMGVPMHPASWCGPGNYTHPATVRQMHERYIRAGADIITTNTFNTLHPALEASGYSDLVREINTRAVDAAREARDRAGGDRPVYIAGSISCRTPIRDRRTGTFLGGTGYGYGASISTEELRAYAGEQAEILAESGVDFLLMENMWADNESRVVATEAAQATGLPVWVGFTASMAPGRADGQDEPGRRPSL